MAWAAPVFPITGQLITAGFWGAQITANMLILKTCVSDSGYPKYPDRIVSTSGAILTSDVVVFIDTTIADVTMTLPSIASASGQKTTVLWWTGTHTASVRTSGVEPVGNGSMPFLFELVGQSQDFYCNPGAWWFV